MTPDQVYLAALAGLPSCTGARLRTLLHAAGTAADVFDAVRAGRALTLPGVSEVLGSAASTVAPAWSSAARRVDLHALERRLTAANVSVSAYGTGSYPSALVDDPEPPVVLFASAAGHEPTSFDALPRVAIVGTRRCTHYGSDVSRELGRGLAAAGVCVVSGLALGIDGAAHEGALFADAAPPLAVVGSGLDVIYPRRHRRLWERVGVAGAVMSEAPMGAPAEPWRFPLRNRIIAGFADVVVVVESHAAGGSMHTVQAALERGVPVMAVPGSVKSPSSAGTNRLLAEGVAPVLDVDDVLVALALEARPNAASGDLSHPPLQLDPALEAVLVAVDFTPTSTEEILRRTGLGLAAGASALTNLEIAGLVRSRGGWWERRGEVRST